MSQREGIGEQTVDRVRVSLDVLEAAAKNKRIDPHEQGRVISAIAELLLLWPLLLVIASTLRGIGQLAHVGIVRFPLPATRREIAELSAKVIDIKPYLEAKKKAANPSTPDAA